MQALNPELIEQIEEYIQELYTPADPVLSANLDDAAAAGLPAIQVSANQGRLIYLLAKIARARRVLEIGTLAGYSTTWLARALPPDGMLITLEGDARHAEVARRNLDRAGLPVRVEIRVGRAAGLLRELIRARTDAFDLIFIDADKASYAEYLDCSIELSHSGTLILADNVIRHGAVLEDRPADANDRGAKAYNEVIARHPRLESLVVPIIRDRIDGMAISMVR
ncbi:MAG TPA: O-methyltransferase [Bryobacteraceae bacterium]|nr:O-methyltransferase [Bryobacteraceae bacterium]